MEKNFGNSHEICILYGSQTGTAKFAAEELQRELNRYKFITSLNAMDSYDIMNLPEENFIIFVVSTTGYGETPCNMKNFWKFLLRKDLPEDSLENLNYTIFGLGDSSYEKFNYVAKMLNNRLKQLSANLIYPVGLGDDQHDFGYEGEFDPWCKELIKVLNYEYFPGKSLVHEKISFNPKYLVEIIDKCEDNEESNPICKFETFFYNNNKIFYGMLNKVKILSGENSIRKVFNIKINLDSSSNNENDKNSNNEIIPKYSPGDVLLIYPINDEESVIRILNILNLNGNEIISITKTLEDEKNIFPSRIKAKELFERWININGIPTRYFARIAADYCSDERHIEKLNLFASKTSVKYLS